MPSAIDRKTLVSQLQATGVRDGAVLLVHTAFSAVRPVQGGPRGLILALRDALGPGGTLVMPSWPGGRMEPFDPKQTACDPDLGIVADTFWRMPGVKRGDHFHAFAADGPLAGQVVGDPLPLPPHIPESPVGRVHELGGQILLLGVNHDANTMVHLAEVLAGVPYGIIYEGLSFEGGRWRTVRYRENDHCCARFRLVDRWLDDAGLQVHGAVGHGHARLVRSKDVTAIVLRKLARDPLLFLHEPRHACAECDLSRAGIPDGPGRID